ncbi:MAG: methylmalonyl Co-A mutase-associated GTPase MeaB [Cyclobacteriaceae bacterium]
MGSPKQSGVQAGQRLGLAEYARGIRHGDRGILSKAITLVESQLASDEHLANDLVQSILPDTGKAIRIGITGVPGVGKSTFIDTFGTWLTSSGKKVAVLAIDPSSRMSRGSILGDKTRMEALSKDPNAFIRPTATGDHLGGVANKTKEALLLCEAAGFDIILVETVGVGQSEFAVREIVDFFLLLMMGGAGDELQGIKKGIMEMADGLIITKADGDNIRRSHQAQVDYQQAIHLLPKSPSGWTPQVQLTSALAKTGIQETWEMITRFIARAKATGYVDNLRNEQDIRWLHQTLEARFRREVMKSEKLRDMVAKFERQVVEKKISAGKAAETIWAALGEIYLVP